MSVGSTRLMLLAVAVAGLAIGYVLWPRPEALTYTVVRGDTLGEIATAYGVTVEELRSWNHIQGDLIEVGDILYIHGTAEAELPATPSAPRPRPRVGAPTPGPSAEAQLVMPAAKPCVAPPTGGSGDGDQSMVASQGLSYAEVKQAMDAFIPTTLRCVPEGVAGRLETRVTVGCNGLVSLVETGATGGLPDEVVDCVTDTLRYAPFPAHALPDGDVFEYPLTFQWD